MTTMSFSRDANPREAEANLRRQINQAIPGACEVQDRHQWQLGIRSRRAFPPGHEIMVDSCRLYMNPEATRIVHLIKGGHLIDNSGHAVDMNGFDATALLKILIALEGIVDFERNNQIRRSSVRPIPAPLPPRQGFWDKLCRLLGI